MGFKLHIKDDAVMLGGKPKVLKQDILSRKFGSEEYDAVKSTFTKALEGWKGHEE